MYRQLESLVDEGIVNKYFVDDNSPACFEYIGGDGRKGPDECFHCKCEKCGRSFTECVRTVSGQKKIRREKAAINGGSEIAKHNKRAAAAAIALPIMALYICIIPVSYGTVQETLVSQKVRLND